MAVKKRENQHDLRGAILARLADDCKALADQRRKLPFADQEVTVLEDMTSIFRTAAKRERKLR